MLQVNLTHKLETIDYMSLWLHCEGGTSRQETYTENLFS